MNARDDIAGTVTEYYRRAVTEDPRIEADGGGVEIDAQVREYWEWIAIALFLFATVDTITTFYAVELLGIAGEANPVIRWALERGLPALVAVNIAAVLIVAGLFNGVIAVLNRLSDPYRRYFAAGIEAWLGGLLAAGLVVFANNLTAIFFGQSLF